MESTRRADALGTPTRMIVLGYYDGETAGVMQFGGDGGPVYRFEMPNEEGQLSRRGWPPREFAFSPMPGDALDRLEEALGRHLNPQRPEWGVNWQFPTPEAEQETDAAVGAILAEAGPAEWLVALPPYWTLADFHPVRVTPRVPA